MKILIIVVLLVISFPAY
ncbi:TPA: type I toxin-antitoxin system Ibs family toxin [Escherichia coli]|nr:type I toxin-antitoxin system Ibs family toxin [Escherichia coli]